MYHEINITTYDRFCVSAISNGCGTKREDRKQHQTLETVFEQVESQTGLLIMFSNNELDVNRKITLDVRKYTLNELFRKVLEGTEHGFRLEQNYVIIRSRPSGCRAGQCGKNE